ncbi:hypothetical protein V8E54_002995 [Elaphomyces granulatus]
MDAFADSAHRYFSGIVHDNDQLSRLVKATPYFVNSEAPNEETCQILLGGSISPEKGLCAHIEYTKNLKTAHAILDVLKNIIFYYEIEHMSSSSQAEAIKELSEKNGLSTRILTDFANKGRIYREIFIRAGPGDLAFLSDHKHIWERETNIKDVRLLLDFRRSQYPQQEKEVRRFDPIVGGLIASRLPSFLLPHWHSSKNALVTKQLKIYLDILLEGQEQLDSWYSEPWEDFSGNLTSISSHYPLWVPCDTAPFGDVASHEHVFSFSNDAMGGFV